MLLLCVVGEGGTKREQMRSVRCDVVVFTMHESDDDKERMAIVGEQCWSQAGVEGNVKCGGCLEHWLEDILVECCVVQCNLFVGEKHKLEVVKSIKHSDGFHDHQFEVEVGIANI